MNLKNWRLWWFGVAGASVATVIALRGLGAIQETSERGGLALATIAWALEGATLMGGFLIGVVSIPMLFFERTHLAAAAGLLVAGCSTASGVAAGIAHERIFERRLTAALGVTTSLTAAVEDYKQREGRAPSSLADLAPTLGSAIPQPRLGAYGRIQYIADCEGEWCLRLHRVDNDHYL